MLDDQALRCSVPSRRRRIFPKCFDPRRLRHHGPRSGLRRAMGAEHCTRDEPASTYWCGVCPTRRQQVGPPPTLVSATWPAPPAWDLCGAIPWWCCLLLSFHIAVVPLVFVDPPPALQSFTCGGAETPVPELGLGYCCRLRRGTCHLRTALGAALVAHACAGRSQLRGTDDEFLRPTVADAHLVSGEPGAREWSRPPCAARSGRGRPSPLVRAFPRRRHCTLQRNTGGSIVVYVPHKKHYCAAAPPSVLDGSGAPGGWVRARRFLRTGRTLSRPTGGAEAGRITTPAVQFCIYIIIYTHEGAYIKQTGTYIYIYIMYICYIYTYAHIYIHIHSYAYIYIPFVTLELGT